MTCYTGVTSLLLSGIVRLTESLKKPLPLTQVQVEKFGNYLLSRRSVQSAKGMTCLLEATKALTGKHQIKFHFIIISL